MGFFSKKQKEDTSVAMLAGDGSFRFHVVGESYHLEALLTMIRAAPDDERQDGEVHKVAVLLPEPNNEYDRRAIAVMIDGMKVGHVPKTDTDLIHEVIDSLQDQGYRYPAVQAVIGWNGDPRQVPVGVRYDLTYERTPLSPDLRPKPGAFPGAPRVLNRGAGLDLVDIDDELVASIRASTERQKSVGHVVEVHVAMDPKGDIWVRYDGVALGRIDPELAGMYRAQFRTLSSRGEYGVTVAHVKWDGSKSNHTVNLAYARDGIL